MNGIHRMGAQVNQRLFPSCHRVHPVKKRLMPRVLAIGLYLDPPEHAVVLCVDEKTAIQALDRLDPVLPLSPGRAERHGFEYCRYGTLSLYTALEVGTGRVDGMPEARHASASSASWTNSFAAIPPSKNSL